MRSRQPASDSYRSKIIDVDVNEPQGVTDPSEVSEVSDASPRLGPQTFRERHALKVMGAVMGVMFATVIVAQVRC